MWGTVLADVEDRKITNPVVRWFGIIALGIVGVMFSLWFLDDQMGWINRWKFDWPSFATLATGAAAVIGAVWIGTKQVGITNEQVRIADRQSEIMAAQANIMQQQVDIQHITLKSELYDKRIKVFTEIRDYAQTLSNPGMKINLEIKDSLLIALESCKFLFDDEIYEKACRIYVDVNTIHKDIQNHVSAHRPYQDNFRLESEYWLPKMEPVAVQVSDLSRAILPFMRLDERRTT